MNILQALEYEARYKAHRQAFMKEQTECLVCHGPLDIFVESVNEFVVKEEARCSQCMALTRVESQVVH